MNIWDKLGVKPADILLPANCDTEKWSCIACDQFTSDKEYWDEMDRFVGDAPSTLRITFPEIYLGRDDESYIAGIKNGFQISRKERKVSFRLAHLGNYAKIQLDLWINMVRRMTGWLFF